MRYSFVFSITFTVLTLSIMLASYNFYKDPYWFWRKAPSWVHSEALDTKQRFVKAIKAIKYRPDIVVIGSSRIYRGINTEHLKQFGYNRPYNLGISSLKLYEIYHILKNHLQLNLPQKIIIGLDYWMFDINRLKESDFCEDKQNKNHIHHYTNKLIASLLSYSSFIDSKNHTKDIRSADGIWKEDGFHETVKREKNASILMLQGYVDYLRNFNYKRDSLKLMSKIINLCKKKKVKLALYISPIHFQTSLAYFNSKHFNNYDLWKNEVSDLCIKENIQIFDFSSDFLTKGETDPGSDWLDYSHFSPMIGDIIVARIEAK